MDWSSIIYTAIGAGGGGALFALIVMFAIKIFGRKSDDSENNSLKTVKGWITAAGAAIGVVVVPALYKNMTLPRIIPLGDAYLINEIPMLEYIKDGDPDGYEVLKAKLDKAMRSGGSDLEALADFRADLQAVILEKQQIAGPKPFRAEYEVSSELFQHLKEKAPVVCTQKLYDLPHPLLSSYLPEAYVAREQKAMALYFTEPPRDPDLNIDMEAAERWVRETVTDIVSTYGIEDMEPEPDDLEGNRKICDFQTSLNQRLAALDDDTLLNHSVYLFSNQ